MFSPEHIHEVLISEVSVPFSAVAAALFNLTRGNRLFRDLCDQFTRDYSLPFDSLISIHEVQLTLDSLIELPDLRLRQGDHPLRRYLLHYYAQSVIRSLVLYAEDPDRAIANGIEFPDF